MRAYTPVPSLFRGYYSNPQLESVGRGMMAHARDLNTWEAEVGKPA